MSPSGQGASCRPSTAQVWLQGAAAPASLPLQKLARPSWTQGLFTASPESISQQGHAAVCSLGLCQLASSLDTDTRPASTACLPMRQASKTASLGGFHLIRYMLVVLLLQLTMTGMGATAPAFVPAVLAPLADGIINPAIYSGCGAQQRYQAWPARAGLNLEKVEIVLIQQIRTGAGAPAPAPGPTAPAPLAQKIIGLPITPAATPSSAPALAPVQQSAASAGAAGQDNKKTIIIAVVCVVGAAGDHRIMKPCTPKACAHKPVRLVLVAGLLRRPYHCPACRTCSTAWSLAAISTMIQARH